MAPRKRIEGRTLEEVARHLFGDDEGAVRRWLDFWATGPERCRQMLDTLFEQTVLVDYRRKSVLDVGCGTGALADVLEPAPAFYAGVDAHSHVVRLGPRRPGVALLQASGTDLPFEDESFDYVFALDVLEHVQGGRGHQVRFLAELRRVIRPSGMIFLTTPNRWYPFEGHTGLPGPQFLPRPLADLYIRQLRPAFLKEHGSFGEITSLGPVALRRCLGRAGLAFLHDLPCGLDREEYRRLSGWRAAVGRLGLDWWPHAEFWGVIVRSEKRKRLRCKLRSRSGLPSGQVEDFRAGLDFSRDRVGTQLGTGWHDWEAGEFRWTAPEATAWLQSFAETPYLRIRGFSPHPNRVVVSVDEEAVGEFGLGAGEAFDRTFLLPRTKTAHRVFTVRLKCLHGFPGEDGDLRELGIAVTGLSLEAELSEP